MVVAPNLSPDGRGVLSPVATDVSVRISESVAQADVTNPSPATAVSARNNRGLTPATLHTAVTRKSSSTDAAVSAETVGGAV